ncbi:MAG: hypothetical protein RL308_905 [Bacteroidota bacterium]|jgi:hypothetical protein
MRVGSIFYLLIAVSIFILLVFLTTKDKQTTVTPIQIECKVKNETVTLQDNNQFCVDIQLTNNSHPTFMLPTQLEYGFKSYNEAFYFEAQNENDKEVVIETESDYDWNVFNSKMLPFSVGDTLKKTICSSGMYAFKEKGTYRLRFVFNPNTPFSHKGKVNSQIIYSNWETITVK